VIGDHYTSLFDNESGIAELIDKRGMMQMTCTVATPKVREVTEYLIEVRFRALKNRNTHPSFASHTNH
jgi:hypothetical protein